MEVFNKIRNVISYGSSLAKEFTYQAAHYIAPVIEPFWYSATQIFRQPSKSLIRTFKESKELSNAFLESSLSKLFYLIPIIIYERLKSSLRDDEDGQDASFFIVYTAFLADMTMQLVLFRFSINNKINTIGYNSALAYTSTQAHPTSIEFKSCDCKSYKKVQSDLATHFNYLTNMAISSGLEWGGWALGNNYLVFAGYMVRSFTYAQSLDEYAIAAPGICSRHRYEELSKRKRESLGTAVSLLATTAVASRVVAGFFYIDNNLAYPLAFDLMFQLHIMLALHKNKHWTEATPGYDVFYYKRIGVNKLATKFMEWVIPRLAQQEMRAQWVDTLHKVLHSRFVSYLIPELTSLHALVKQPGISLSLKQREKGISAQAAWVKSLHGWGYSLIFVNWALERMPNHFVPKKNKQEMNCIISLLRDMKINRVVSQTDDLLLYARENRPRAYLFWERLMPASDHLKFFEDAVTIDKADLPSAKPAELFPAPIAHQQKSIALLQFNDAKEAVDDKYIAALLTDKKDYVFIDDPEMPVQKDKTLPLALIEPPVAQPSSVPAPPEAKLLPLVSETEMLSSQNKVLVKKEEPAPELKRTTSEPNSDWVVLKADEPPTPPPVAKPNLPSELKQRHTTVANAASFFPSMKETKKLISRNMTDFQRTGMRGLIRRFV